MGGERGAISKEGRERKEERREVKQFKTIKKTMSNERENSRVRKHPSYLNLNCWSSKGILDS